MTLRDDMREYREAHPGVCAEELANGFLKRVTKSELLPLLVQEFWRHERTDIRALEARALAQCASGPRPVRSGRAQRYAESLGGLRDLLDKPYRFQRDGEEKLLRYMSREEHQARIDGLLAQRNGIERSIEVHREAIRLIDAAHVTCLDDLDKSAAAAA